jgi:imidazolonepropionase-like amidohydrolase
MGATLITTDAYFDGAVHHADGPYQIRVDNGMIAEVAQGTPETGEPSLEAIHSPFLMPGLVEGHCHLFLEGGELDFQKRKDYLNAPFEEMLSQARSSMGQNIKSGITLIRDAGDIHGINTRLKKEIDDDPQSLADLLSPGVAIRKAGRYGSFMGREVTDIDSIIQTVREIAPTASQLKIILTGIIDFEKGIMKGDTQFSLEETRVLVDTAKELGLLTYAHCSGEEGLRIAVEAGIDSIEHGFFMTREILQAMADKQIAWVPTYSPVDFQLQHPELAGWDSATCDRLRSILENHDTHIALAYEMGVPIVAGSDAGSYGVVHGEALIDELCYLHQAGGSVANVLASATSLPRRLWHCPSADIIPGNPANLLLLGGSPFENLENIRHPRGIFRHSWHPFQAEASTPNI